MAAETVGLFNVNVGSEPHPPSARGQTAIRVVATTWLLFTLSLCLNKGTVKLARLVTSSSPCAPGTSMT
ncbi:predicted protein [Pyrenophora tritici-repentis Pt-1C-BFP]|uniref:Uncharacterized protein n=1 Tax=Pyrenophora tritici-repentis (strain Pt-1C-BFP) TaxID=426418 RepID=B2VQK9_PYRTR|nr:uncharacterized protein PTRG_00563 [Pyrenophora tritici-repentis Pt-1C-BFP]EDU40001.1 predicted protein [Pyrenophora tritici-repentis Pt-1C-BFP]